MENEVYEKDYGEEFWERSDKSEGDELYRTVEEFAYVTYNHVRPHSYNGYCTPYQARTAA